MHLKRTLGLLFAITLSTALSQPAEARLTPSSKFDIYDLGPVEPVDVANNGFIVANDRIRSKGVALFWRMSSEIGTRPHPVFPTIYLPFETPDMRRPFLPDQPSTVTRLRDDGSTVMDFVTGDIAYKTTVGNVFLKTGIQGYYSPASETESLVLIDLRVPIGEELAESVWTKANTSFGNYVAGAHGPRSLLYLLEKVSTGLVRRLPTTLDRVIAGIVESEGIDGSNGVLAGTYSLESSPEEKKSFFVDLRELDSSREEQARLRPDIFTTDMGTLGGRETVVNKVQTTSLPAAGVAYQVKAVGWSRNGDRIKKAFIAYPTFTSSNTLSSRMVSLGTLSGNELEQSEAIGISNEEEIVGWTQNPKEREKTAFVYLPGTGMIDLSSMLRESSAQSDWQLLEATAISMDGTYIVGKGLHTPTVYVRRKGHTVREIAGPTEERGFALSLVTGPSPFKESGIFQK